MRSHFLIAGLAVALVAPVCAAQDVPLSKIQIVEGQAKVTESGFVRIAFEVWNRSERWITNPRIEVDLFDAQGKELGSDSIATAVAQDMGRAPKEFVYPDRTFIPPGEMAVATFLRDQMKIKGKYASHRLRVVTVSVVPDPPKMVIDGMKTEKIENTFHVTGQIRNAGTVPCRSPKVVIAVYGPDKKQLQNVDTETPDETFQKKLAPGKSVAFHAKVFENFVEKETIGRLEAWGDCNTPD